MSTQELQISNPPRLHIPYDVQLLIVDLAATNYRLRSLLGALASTHRALRSECQRHIFSSISSRSHNAFLEFLEVSPHLPTYVRTLEIRSLSQLNEEGEGETFLDKLPHLRTLSIGNYSNTHWGQLVTLSWKRLHKRLAVGLLRHIRSPQLHSLTICGISGFPVEAFIHLYRFSDLQILAVSKLSLSKNGDYQQEIISTGSRNSNLTASSAQRLCQITAGEASTDLLKVLLGIPTLFCEIPPAFNFCNVRKLSVVWGCSETTKDMIAASGAVEELACLLNTRDTGATFQRISEPILSRSRHTLKQLTFSHVDLFQPLSLYNIRTIRLHLPNIIGELALLTGHVNALESMVISTEIWVVEQHVLETALYAAVTQCHILDKLLADIHNFPSLQRFRLHILFRVINKVDYSAGYVNGLNKTMARVRGQCFGELGKLRSVENVEFNIEFSL